MTGLQGKVAMVTGCGGERGLGRGIARRLAAGGADLVLTDIVPTGTPVLATKPIGLWGGLPAVAAEAMVEGVRAITALLDIRSAPQIDGVVAQALAAFGRIDILVNNAASPPGADRVPVVDLPEEAWDAVLDTNLKGTFLVSRSVARVMLQRKDPGPHREHRLRPGQDRHPEPGGVLRLQVRTGRVHAVAWRWNWRRPGSRSTRSAPAAWTRSGWTISAGGRTAATTRRSRAAEIRRREALNPLGRLTRPEDVAEVVAFLASDGAEYLTGQAINVAGGSVMH